MTKAEFLEIKTFREYVKLKAGHEEEIRKLLKDDDCLKHYSKLIDEEKDISFLAVNGVIVEAFYDKPRKG